MSGPCNSRITQGWFLCEPCIARPSDPKIIKAWFVCEPCISDPCDLKITQVIADVKFPGQENHCFAQRLS